MRLGELKTKTRDCDGRQVLCLTNYQNGEIKKLEIDIITKNHVFFRIVDDN